MKSNSSAEAQKKPLNKAELMKVRGMCLMQGTTLYDWFEANGYIPSTSYNAVVGRRSGPVSRRILAAVREEFNV